VLPDLASLFLFTLPAVLLAISIHEFAHGAMADHLGDPTPRFQGRLTLNPLAHLDPVGALMLVLFRFGWARPVMVNPRNFVDPRRGMFLVALAGPAANLVMAYFFAALASFLPGFFPLTTGRLLFEFFMTNILLNLWLAAFNLLPIPPLDGAKILQGLLPGRQAYALAQWEPYGPLLLIFLIMSGMVPRLLQPIFRVLAWGLRFF
jgi:Zn-dependent protease